MENSELYFAADKFFIREENIKEFPTHSIDNKVLYEDAIKENLAKDAYLKRLAKFIREGM
ncbi:hypothetical protein HNQ69_000299 [Bartonella callosciuri]|uniref:Uncharacterized protein n=1 Tax=Bartonella callosciuri TaxID=686223 RepID=A0A840NTC0_9HYPH|nr:hypothetical protein [Bartonella callosciuri]MBB5073195.1 hypothetical protein [Bartonella callosciuri]